MPRGSKPSTTPGPCDTCGREKRWRADSRRATGGYWTCSHGIAGDTRGRNADTVPRRKPALTSAIPTRPRIGTQEWLTNPEVRACKSDGCFWDARTCPAHRYRY